MILSVHAAQHSACTSILLRLALISFNIKSMLHSVTFVDYSMGFVVVSTTSTSFSIIGSFCAIHNNCFPPKFLFKSSQQLRFLGHFATVYCAGLSLAHYHLLLRLLNQLTVLFKFKYQDKKCNKIYNISQL